MIIEKRIKKGLRILFLQVLFFAWCFFAENVYANTKPIKVLFIGNSLTSANNLPKMVVDIARSKKHNMVYDWYTPGGSKLSDHAKSPEVLAKIKSQKWDFVVLQEQSQLPGWSFKQKSKEMFPYVKALVKAIKTENPKTDIVFYMTMAAKGGDMRNGNISRSLLTYDGTQKRVNKCYLDLAKDNYALVAPVGIVWRKAIKDAPGRDLYSDNSHPNQTGTYLVACVFYSTFFQSPVAGAAIPEQINEKAGKALQTLVDNVAYKNRDKCDFRK